jgi:hypothetical protein
MTAVQALEIVRAQIIETRHHAGQGTGQWFGLLAALEIVEAALELARHQETAEPRR